jgi:hypothetical protein
VIRLRQAFTGPQTAQSEATRESSKVRLEAVSEAPVRSRTAINAVAPATGGNCSGASTKTGESTGTWIITSNLPRASARRLDYAADAWHGPPEDSLGDWITIVADDGAKSQTLDTESLFRYFEQLCEDANPAHDKLRYVLALLLLQKRRLRLEGTHRDEDDNDFLDLIGSKSEGPYEVPDLSLDEDEIAQLQASLHHQLEEEWS